MAQISSKKVKTDFGSKLDKIPDENDELSVLVDGYCFQIHKVENHRIKEVLVYKTQPNENGKEIIQEN